MVAESARAVVGSLRGLAAGEKVGVMLRDDAVCPRDIVPLVAAVDFHRRRGVDFTVAAPDGTTIATAIAGLTADRLGPDIENPPVNPFGRVWRFSSYDEQNALANAMTLQLGKSALLGKGVKEAFVWCLNEVMDNVLTHSSPGGDAVGYVMVTVASESKRLKACVRPGHRPEGVVRGNPIRHDGRLHGDHDGDEGQRHIRYRAGQRAVGASRTHPPGRGRKRLDRLRRGRIPFLAEGWS